MGRVELRTPVQSAATGHKALAVRCMDFVEIPALTAAKAARVDPAIKRPSLQRLGLLQHRQTPILEHLRWLDNQVSRLCTQHSCLMER